MQKTAFSIAFALVVALILTLPIYAQDCPNLEEIVGEFPGFAANRLPFEMESCAPPASIGDNTWCDGLPPDGHPCAAAGEGCSLRMRVLSADAQTVQVETTFTGNQQDGCEFAGTLTSTYTLDFPYETVGSEVQIFPVVAYPPDPIDVLDCEGQPLPNFVAHTLRQQAWLRLKTQLEQFANAHSVQCDPDVDPQLVDSDGDGTFDCFDGCPSDPNKTDAGCGCGTVDDVDGDGVAYCTGDCDDFNLTIWGTPGEVQGIVIKKGLNGSVRVNWPAQTETGGIQNTYEILRSKNPNDFSSPFCISPLDFDVEPTLPGELFVYLVRSINDCPDGVSTLGTDSAGEERSAGECP